MLAAKCESVKTLHCEKEYNCEKNFILLEKELKEKYLESIYSCAEKVMSKSQSSQLTSLKSLHDHEASEVMKKIELDFKEHNEKGSLASISKEDLQRDRRAWLVNRGVMEKQKLQELYNEKKAELEAGHKEAKEELKERLSKEKKEVSEECQQSITTLEARLVAPES
jgi:multidrug resistance efflux pump